MHIDGEYGIYVAVSWRGSDWVSVMSYIRSGYSAHVRVLDGWRLEGSRCRSIRIGINEGWPTLTRGK